MFRNTLFSSTDLKQLVWCERIVHYKRVLKVKMPNTGSMKKGTEVTKKAERKFKTWDWKRYTNKPSFALRDVELFSSDGLYSGIPDAILETGSEWIPIEFKYTDRLELRHKLQLILYMELANQNGKRCSKGLFESLLTREIIEIPYTERNRSLLQDAIERTKLIISENVTPEPTMVEGRCDGCEYRAMCSDRW